MGSSRRFCSRNRSGLRQDERTGRIRGFERRQDERALFLAMLALGGPLHLLAEIGRGFSQGDFAVSIGIGFSAQRAEEIICEESMSMFLVFNGSAEASNGHEMNRRIA
jgi:hypothetical protein